jgi:hypothetical protein
MTKVRGLYEPFEASSVDMFRCDCGCGTLKVGLYDTGGNLRALFGFRPEDWPPMLEDILAECQRMLEDVEV